MGRRIVMPRTKRCLNCGEDYAYPGCGQKEWDARKTCSLKCRVAYKRATTPSWEERFWAKVDRRQPDDCWEWQATGTRAGYGLFGGSGTARLTHRIAWELSNGEIPEGKWVCHRCDNPPCCNPHHLFLGTPTDNVADMHQKGRHRSNARQGSAHQFAKLTEEDVRGIRADTRPQRLIAQDYGVSPSAIAHIKTGRTWGHVE